MATIVQRNQEVSQAITYFHEDDVQKFTLQPNETREVWSREHTGIIYAVYLLSDINLINFQIEMDDQYGINNCAFDLWNVQGQTTRDSGILFCKTYNNGYWKKRKFWQKDLWIPVNLFSVSYENGYGMRYNDKIAITVKNLSKDSVGKVLEIMILYATVCD